MWQVVNIILVLYVSVYVYVFNMYMDIQWLVYQCKGIGIGKQGK